MFLTEMQKQIGKGSLSTLTTRLIELRNENLIKYETELKFGGRRYIWLTKKGEDVAKLLMEIDNQM